MRLAHELPGIRIETAPPPVAEGLPPMDAAVFVGFAERGPVHRPVPIAGVAELAAYFGGDPVLAYDPGQGEPVRGQLGGAVRAFFANGGRRCWVIRVTRTLELEQAWASTSARAPVPEETATFNRFPVPGVLALTGSPTEPRAAFARAASLGAWSDALRLSTALLSTGVQLGAIETTVGDNIRLETSQPLEPGDLLELGPGDDGGDRLYARVAETGVGTSGAPGAHATLLAAFAPLAPVASATPIDATVDGLGEDTITAQLLPPLTPETDDARLQLEPPLPEGLAEGHWVRWSTGGETAVMRIDRRREQTDNLIVEGPAWTLRDPMLPDPPPASAAKLTLELRVRDAVGRLYRLVDVGLTGPHQASWWQQRDDDHRYDRAAAGRQGMLASGADEGAYLPAPFPLAAEDSNQTEASATTWLPLGVEAIAGAALGPLPQASDALHRDGLVRFDAELFLDPALADVGIPRLMAASEYLRFMADMPRRPFGIHGALAIGSGERFNDASLIAVPDAAQPGWLERPTEALPDADPVPTAVPHWSGHRGPCLAQDATSTLSQPDFSRFLDCVTRALAAPAMDPIANPVQTGLVDLSWTAPEPDVTFVLEESISGRFDDAREVYAGSDRGTRILAPRDGIYYYRVRACSGGEQSPASAPITVLVRTAEWVVREPGDMSEHAALLRIHHALLRMAAAHGDLFAVLALPRGFNAHGAATYAGWLRTSFSAPGTGDGLSGPRALSFGAIYHPWLVCTRFAAGIDPSGAAGAATAPQQVCSPDGAILGTLAARSRERGAWISPANMPLGDLVGLTPDIDVSNRMMLQGAKVNLLRGTPNGFLALASQTLSDDPDWTQINVRRLFCLLRRIAIRRGQRYVFEPNGDLLSRAVERGFDDLLGDLFRRGAFAGATPGQSFAVRVDRGARNTGEDDRLLVELRVAPAHPLRFLTLRLLQQGEQLSAEEGV